MKEGQKMTKEEIDVKLEVIKESIIKQTNIKEVGDDMNFREDYGLDSLDFLIILSDAEDEFGIEIDNEEAAGLKNFKDLREYVYSKFGAI